MFERLLERIALALDAAGIDYMVIGGQAVLLHGEPRLTKDIDITLGVDLDRLDDLLRAARTAGLEPLVDPEEFTRRTMVLPARDPASGIRVDFILSFSPYERQAIGRAIEVRLGQAGVKYATVEDLIVHKIVAGRARDLEDVRALLLKNRQVDVALVTETLAEFGKALERPLTVEFESLWRECGAEG